MESVKEHPNYLPDYFGPCKDHQIDLHEIMNFDDLRSFFWFCPVFRILLNCPFFEKRKNRSYPTIDHFFPLLSPPPPMYREKFWIAKEQNFRKSQKYSVLPQIMVLSVGFEEGLR